MGANNQHFNTITHQDGQISPVTDTKHPLTLYSTGRGTTNPDEIDKKFPSNRERLVIFCRHEESSQQANRTAAISNGAQASPQQDHASKEHCLSAQQKGNPAYVQQMGFLGEVAQGNNVRHSSFCSNTIGAYGANYVQRGLTANENMLGNPSPEQIQSQQQQQQRGSISQSLQPVLNRNQNVAVANTAQITPFNSATPQNIMYEQAIPLTTCFQSSSNSNRQQQQLNQSVQQTVPIGEFANQSPQQINFHSTGVENASNQPSPQLNISTGFSTSSQSSSFTPQAQQSHAHFNPLLVTQASVHHLKLAQNLQNASSAISQMAHQSPHGFGGNPETQKNVLQHTTAPQKQAHYATMGTQNTYKPSQPDKLQPHQNLFYPQASFQSATASQPFTPNNFPQQHQQPSPQLQSHTTVMPHLYSSTIAKQHQSLSQQQTPPSYQHQPAFIVESPQPRQQVQQKISSDTSGAQRLSSGPVPPSGKASSFVTQPPSTQQNQTTIRTTPIPSIEWLDQQLVMVERFYLDQGLPWPRLEFQAYLGQIRQIQDRAQRQLAQENLIVQMQQLLLKSKQQSMMLNASQRHHHHPFQGGTVGYDHRRDYSSSSSASKISSSSSVSSQQRSSHQNNLKIALAQAFRDLDKLISDEERTQFLITKAHLFSKDKNGFQLLKNKIDEEVFQLQQLSPSATRDANNYDQRPQQGKFVNDLLNLLLSPEFTAFHKLMMHQVANFFCQELFRQASPRQLEQVIEIIRNDFFKIAADMHGTRALQVLLQDELIQNEKCTDRVPLLLHEALKNGRIFDLCCNIRGNHVIRQCLVLLRTDERRAIIYDTVVQNFAHVARDKHGCQVAKDCITTAQGQWKKDLIRVSQESIEILINDEYGNFVIQAILEHFISLSKRKSKIMDVRVSCFYEFIRLNLGKLCKQQYSSRVVEKAIDTMPKEQFEKVCQIIMKNSSKKNKLYKEIMIDSFGNYIAPKILERAKSYGFHYQFDYFSKVYRESIDALKKVKHGRQLINKINQIVQTQGAAAVPGKAKGPSGQALNANQSQLQGDPASSGTPSAEVSITEQTSASEKK